MKKKEKKQTPANEKKFRWSIQDCKECPLKSKCLSSRNLKDGKIQKMCED
ncbi:MAG: hypothetical protein WC459_01850 [Patescibacteria group bacterium]